MVVKWGLLDHYKIMINVNDNEINKVNLWKSISWPLTFQIRRTSSCSVLNHNPLHMSQHYVTVFNSNCASSVSLSASTQFPRCLKMFPSSRLSEEVFWQCLSKIGRRHENSDGTYNVEETEPDQEEAIDDGCSKLPLLRQAELPVLLPNAFH